MLLLQKGQEITNRLLAAVADAFEARSQFITLIRCDANQGAIAGPTLHRLPLLAQAGRDSENALNFRGEPNGHHAW